MAYYHDLVTEESWKELQTLQKSITFVLMGGWAVYLYTHGLKSKDIDILVEYSELPNLAKQYQLAKNDRLHKYEAVKGPVQIDIYLPHYSQIGLPVETLLLHTTVQDGFTVLKQEYLIALKLFTLKQRGRTPKGRKDFLDILSLYTALSPDPIKKAVAILKNNQLNDSLIFFRTILSEYTEVPELSLNVHQFKKIKTTLQSIL